MIEATMPLAGLLAPAIICWIASAPSLPTMPWIWLANCPVAASLPNTSPASAINKISSGANERTV